MTVDFKMCGTCDGSGTLGCRHAMCGDPLCAPCPECPRGQAFEAERVERSRVSGERRDAELLARAQEKANDARIWKEEAEEQRAAFLRRDDALNQANRANERLTAQVKEMRRALEEARSVLSLSDPEGRRAATISAPEDGTIAVLCERIGYGAVMDSAARLWRVKDPVGAITTGACATTVRQTISQIQAALATSKEDK